MGFLAEGLEKKPHLNRQQHLLLLNSRVGRSARIALPFRVGSDLANRLMLKDLPGADTQALLSGHVHDAQRDDRVAAQLEEVIVHAHSWGSQYPRPDARQ